MRPRQHDRVVYVPPSQRQRPSPPESPGPQKVTVRKHVVQDTGSGDLRCETCGDLFPRASFVDANGNIKRSCGTCRAESIRQSKTRTGHAMQCPAITAKGAPCSLPGEPEGGGWCHVHDPNGTFRQQHPTKNL
jgi:hypothetical protein